MAPEVMFSSPNMPGNAHIPRSYYPYSIRAGQSVLPYGPDNSGKLAQQSRHPCRLSASGRLLLKSKIWVAQFVVRREWGVAAAEIQGISDPPRLEHDARAPR